MSVSDFCKNFWPCAVVFSRVSLPCFENRIGNRLLGQRPPHLLPPFPLPPPSASVVSSLSTLISCAYLSSLSSLSTLLSCIVSPLPLSSLLSLLSFLCLLAFLLSLLSSLFSLLLPTQKENQSYERPLCKLKSRHLAGHLKANTRQRNFLSLRALNKTCTSLGKKKN